MPTSRFSLQLRRIDSLRSFSLLAVALGLTGCPGDDEPPRADADLTNVAVELGAGAVDFQSLGGSAPDLVLEAGPQGGHHFIVNARIRGFIPGDPSMPGLLGNPSTLFAAFLEDDTQIDLMFPPYRLGYSEQVDGFFYLPSGRILQVEEDQVDALYGQTVRITVQVRDAQGIESGDERLVTVIAPPAGTPDAGPLSDAN